MFTDMPRPEHPRPDKMREHWRNLNGVWQFEIDAGNSGIARGLGESSAPLAGEIVVPFCPESRLSGLAHTDFMPAVWYKRTFNLSEAEKAGRVLLHFGAADYHTLVFVNGKRVCEHFGGLSSFSADISAASVLGENTVTVYCEDDNRSGEQPGGKQSKQYASYGARYTRTTGIWQTVWLEFVPQNYIESFRIIPNLAESAFALSLRVKGAGKATVTASYEGKEVGFAEGKTNGESLSLLLPLSETHLWEPGAGRLYDLVFTFESEGETDTLISYAGLRDVRVDGLKVRINGKSVFQRTVLDQGFYPDGIWTAPSDAALKRDIELSMALGFNGARLHQKIFEPRFLYHADKAGYLVWGEQGSWGLDIARKGGLLDFLPEWAEAVERDFNHPAIIGWCPFNEQWAKAGDLEAERRIIESVYRLTKQLDPTRPVIDSSGGAHGVTDIYDQHDYEQDPAVFGERYVHYDGSEESFYFIKRVCKRFTPDLPFFMSEYGGIKWVADPAKAQADGWGYGNAPKTEEEFFDRYERMTAALLSAPNIFGFCYTQLTDVEQEVNGLYHYDRSSKFKDYSRIIKANTTPAAIEKE